jgi:hypothetical protein
VREPLEIIVAVEGNLTEEQHKASTELLTSKSALQVVRGFFKIIFFTVKESTEQVGVIIAAGDTME